MDDTTEKTARISVGITPPVLAALDRHAQQARWSRSWTAAWLIEEHLKHLGYLEGEQPDGAH